MLVPLNFTLACDFELKEQNVSLLHAMMTARRGLAYSTASVGISSC